MRRNRESVQALRVASQDKVLLPEDQVFLSPDGELFLTPLPSASRRCTDISWLILLAITWLVMTIIGIQATGAATLSNESSVLYVPKGDPQRLFRGMDYEGNLCGIGSEVSSLEKLWHPSDSGTILSSSGVVTPVDFSVCVASCPTTGDIVLDPYAQYGQWTATYDSVEYLGHCRPSTLRPTEMMLVSFFADIVRTISTSAFVGFFLSSFLSILFIFTIRIPYMLQMIITFCIILVFALACYGSHVLAEKVKQERTSSFTIAALSLSDAEVLLLNIASKALIVFAIIWVCTIVLMRRRISIAVEILKESAAALMEMPMLTLLPVLLTIFMIFFTGIWLTYAVYLISSADIKTIEDSVAGISYKVLYWSREAQMRIAFLFFCWVWTAGFMQSIGHLTFSHAVLTWYLGRADDEGQSLSIVWNSVRVVSRYHTGTAAFGSLLLTVFATIRTVIEYARVKLSVITNRSSTASRCFYCIQGLIYCSLCCFDSFLKFIDKHAYIQVALSGAPFLSSAKRAFGLVVRNVGRLAAITLVGDFVVWIGKTTITLLCMTVAYLYISKYQESGNIQGLILPVVFAGWVSYVTSTLYLSLVSSAANTVLQAFLTEEEINRDDEMLASATSRRAEMVEKQIINTDHSPIRHREEVISDIEMATVKSGSAMVLRSPGPSSSSNRHVAHAKSPQRQMSPVPALLPPRPPPPPSVGLSPLMDPRAMSSRYAVSASKSTSGTSSSRQESGDSAFVTTRRDREKSKQLKDDTVLARSTNPFDQSFEEEDGVID